MIEQTIICPFCKKEIPLTQAITQKIEADLRRHLEDDFNKRNSELSSREQVLSVKEQAVVKSAQEVNKKIEEEVARKLVLEREVILKEAKKKAEAENSLQIKALQEDLQSKDKLLQETQKNELLLRKQKSDLEARERNVDLEVARKIDSERANIFVEASRKAAEDFQLKDKDKDKKIADLRSQIEILNRKMEQGSNRPRVRF